MLISCAAVSTIGRIDWEPYIPTIFTRILRSIDLPVSYKGLKSSRNPQMYTGAIASKCHYFILIYKQRIYCISCVRV